MPAYPFKNTRNQSCFYLSHLEIFLSNEVIFLYDEVNYLIFQFKSGFWG
jgi:hypothetical protein